MSEGSATAAKRLRLRRAATEPSAGPCTLQPALREIRQQCDEQRQEIQRLREQLAEYSAALQQRDVELQPNRGPLRGTALVNNQISLSNNRTVSVEERESAAGASEVSVAQGRVGSGAVVAEAREVAASVSENSVSRFPFRGETGLQLRPDTYDGSVPVREFFSQFDLIARANRWDEEAKAYVLISCLRGKARAVLENLQNLQNLEYSELRAKLELRFGGGESFQNFYSQFTNRKQSFGEDLASYGSEIERLSQLAYPECPYTVWDKIACAQFVSSLTDVFVKRTLQLEGITSLRTAIERAKAIKLIQESCFEGESPEITKQLGRTLFYSEKA